MKKLGALVSIALLGLSTSAFAAEIWNHGSPETGQLRWDGFDNGSTAVNVTSYNGSGGQFNGYFYTDGLRSDDEFFRFFCIDLYQYAAQGPLNYEVSIYSNGALARLFDIAYPNKPLGDFYNGAATSFGHFSPGLFSAGIYSSAFQLAVWEIFYETSEATFSLGSGAFKSNTGANSTGSDAEKAVAQAAAWLSAINGGAGSVAGWTLYKFSSGSNQDYLSAVYRQVPEETDNSVPEPGTLAMLGLGIAALGAIRRRKR